MKANPAIACAFFRSMGLSAPEPEHRFHESRRWRFDYAWPEHRVALEVEGGVWTRGRHTRPSIELGDGKRIFDFDYDSSSGSTMVYRGRYKGDVTAQDIIAALGDGTFGHYAPYLNNGQFTYTKITD